MALVKNVSLRPLPLTTGSVLARGSTANVDTSQPAEAGYLSAGQLIIVDGTVAPTPADPLLEQAGRTFTGATQPVSMVRGDVWFKPAGAGFEVRRLTDSGLVLLGIVGTATQASVAAPASGGSRLGLPMVVAEPGYHGNFTPGNTWFGNSSGTDVNQQYDKSYISMAATDGVRLEIANHISESTSTNAVFTVAMAVKDSAGNFYPVFWNGQSTASPAKSATLLSDVVPIKLAKGDAFSVVSFLTMSGGNRWPLHLALRGPSDGFEASGTTDKTASGTVAKLAAGTQQRGFGPNAIVAARPSARVPVVGLIGDSIGAGGNDYVLDRGFFGIALGLQTSAPAASVIWAAKAGELASQFITNAASWRRRNMLDGMTVALSNFGTNDIYNTHSLSQIKADLSALWTLLRSLGAQKVFQTTITPKSTSTDGWTTVAGQTPITGGVEAVRTALNDWIRAGAPVDGYFDVADAAESARNSGKWKVPAVSGTGDTTSGSPTVANVANAASYAVGQFLTGAGIPSGTSIKTIGASSLTLTANATATGTGAAITAATTADGLHPCAWMHGLMAAPIVSATLLA